MFIRINELQDVTPGGLDGHQYRLFYEIGEEKKGVFYPLDSHQVTISTSGSLQAVWGQTDSQVAESSATAAASIIAEVASRGSLDELDEIEPIQLNTFTAAKEPPIEPRAVPGTILSIPELSKWSPERAMFSIISDDIAELRDQINTLSKAVMGGRILELPQE